MYPTQEPQIPFKERTRMRIVRALERDEQERWEKILALLEVGDFTVEEIAGKLDLPQQLVRSDLNELKQSGALGSEAADRIAAALRGTDERR